MLSSRRHTLSLLVAASLAACGRTHSGAHSSRANTRLDVDRLRNDFPALARRAAPARLNLGVKSLSDEGVWTADETGRYPLQSVFKAPLAAAALAEADAGRLTLNEPIVIEDTDLSAPFSLINQQFTGRFVAPAIDLIALAVQRSDNTAADAILKRIGGPGALTAWLQSKGINEMRIDRYEREIQTEMVGMPSFRPAWKDQAAFAAARSQIPPAVREAATQAYLADPRDTATAPGALQFLDKLADGDLISPGSTRLLLRLMTSAKTGPHRLAAALPKGATLAHKTGTSGTDLGLTAATNDIGIVTLEGGRRLAIAVFLAGSTATEAEREALIADCGRLALRAFA